MGIEYPSNSTTYTVEYPDLDIDSKKLIEQVLLVPPSISASCSYSVKPVKYSIEGVDTIDVESDITFDDKGEQLQFYSTLELEKP